jgi:sulfur carrier protein ThiS
MDNKLQITSYRNPFKPGDREIRQLAIIPGNSVADYVRQIDLPGDVAISYNGRILPASEQAALIPRPGDWLAVCPVVHGGGGGEGGGKNPLGLILGIALSVVAMGVGSMMMNGAFMGSGFIAPAAWGWGALIAATAVMAVGGALISGMMGGGGVSTDLTFDDRSSTQTYTWSTMQSLTAQGGSVMITYGTVRTAGQILAEHITSDGDKQYYNALLCGGEGPLDSISEITINDNPIANYSNVEQEIRLGVNDQTVVSNFSDTFDDQVVSAELSVGAAVTRTTEGNAGQGLEITIEFASGLYHLNDAGNLETASVAIQAEYKLHGAGAYTAWGSWTISAASNSAIRRVYRLDGLAAGQYDVRLTCTSKSGTTTRDATRVYWATLSHILYDDFSRPNKALLGIKALATDQLSGGRPTITWLQTRSSVWVWNGSAYVSKPATNPAWACYDLIHRARRLQHPISGSWAYQVDGAPATMLIYQEFLNWATFCDSKSLTVNILIEKSQDLWNALRPIEGCGRGKVILRGTRFAAICDAPTNPVQLFSVGNIKQDSFREEFLDLGGRANAIEVTFTNKDKNYQRDTLTVYAADYDAGATVKNPTQITLDGITTATQAYKEAAYRLRLNKYLTRTVSFDADVDAIACQVGDVILVQHDVPQWGEGGRLVAATETEVTLDKEVALDHTKSYQITVRLADDTLATRSIVVPETDTTTDTLTMQTAFSAAPQQYDVYAFGVANIQTKPFRLVSINRARDLTRQLVALEYNVAVYDEATTIPVIDYTGQSGEISGLVINERLDVGGTAWLDISWHAARNLYAGATVLLNGKLIGKVGAAETSISYSGYTEQVYQVTVVGLGIWGQTLSTLSASYTTQLVIPPDAFSFGVAQNMRQLEHTWAASTSVSGVEIRRLDPALPNWENGQVIASGISGSRFIDLAIALGSWSYGIKTIGRNGAYSAGMVAAQIVVDNIPASNVVLIADLLADPGGTFTNCKLIGGKIVPDSRETWAEFAARYGTWQNTGVWGEPAAAVATYESQAYDVGKIVQALVAAETQQLAGAGTGTVLAWRHSQDGVTWTDWADFIPGSYTFRYHAWRVNLNSASGSLNRLAKAQIKIDVPDLLQKFGDVAITNASAGASIDFSPVYVSTPTVNGNLVDGQVGYCVVVTKSTTGATLKAYNSAGTAITGIIDVQVLGY